MNSDSTKVFTVNKAVSRILLARLKLAWKRTLSIVPNDLYDVAQSFITALLSFLYSAIRIINYFNACRTRIVSGRSLSRPRKLFLILCTGALLRCGLINR